MIQVIRDELRGVSMIEECVTTFQNVDLDIRAENGLEELLGHLGSSVLVLNKATKEATVELNKEHNDLEDTVVELVGLIQSLPSQVEYMETM
jgi:hypothetical protein